MLYARNSNIETLCKAKIQVRVSPQETVSLQLSTPCIRLVRGEWISFSVLEHNAGHHALTSRILNKCVEMGVTRLSILAWFGS